MLHRTHSSTNNFGTVHIGVNSSSTNGGYSHGGHGSIGGGTGRWNTVSILSLTLFMCSLSMYGLYFLTGDADYFLADYSESSSMDLLLTDSKEQEVPTMGKKTSSNQGHQNSMKSHSSKRHEAFNESVVFPFPMPDQSHKNNKKSDASAPWVIFYNLFIPEDGPGVTRTKRIVEDQLNQIDKSFATQSLRIVDTDGKVQPDNQRKILLYFNTIGADQNAASPDGGESVRQFLSAQCSQRALLNCYHMEHFSAGKFEEVTLQRVWEYCGTATANDHVYPSIVLYIHSKGSFHETKDPNYSQEAWRQNMMSAVTSDLCLKPIQQTVNASRHGQHDHKQHCSVCGLLATSWPVLHFPGNMFAADCHYIQKLVPPIDFQRRLSEIAADIMFMRLQGRLSPKSFLRDVDYNYGLGRFASEHWVGSHPSVTACDVSPELDIQVWRRVSSLKIGRAGSVKDFSFASYPRVDLNTLVSNDNQGSLKEALTIESRRRREIAFLPGLLWKWYELYHEIPPDDSWVWEWFPDGPEWRQKVKATGVEGAIDNVTQKYWGIL